jgi:hypothetical protein
MDSACPRSSADRIGDLLCLLATSLSGGRQNYKDNIKRNIQKEHHSNNDRVTHMALRNRYGESASEKRCRDDAPHRDSPCPQKAAFLVCGLVARCELIHRPCHARPNIKAGEAARHEPAAAPSLQRRPVLQAWCWRSGQSRSLRRRHHTAGPTQTEQSRPARVRPTTLPLLALRGSERTPKWRRRATPSGQIQPRDCAFPLFVGPWHIETVRRLVLIARVRLRSR